MMSTSPRPAPAVATVSTTLDGAPYVVTVRPCPIEQLITGDRTTGPTGAPVHPAPILYEVVVGCAEHPHGWLIVRNLSMTDAQAAALVRDGAVEPGAHPRCGFFSYSAGTLMDLVLDDAGGAIADR